MRTLKPILFLILLIFLSYSCMNEITDNPSSEKEKDLTFSIILPQTSQSTTRALVASDENQVTSVDILLFDTNGKYTFRPIHVTSVQDDANNTAVKTFTATIPSGTFNILVLANSSQSLNSALSTFAQGDSKASVLEKLVVVNSGKWNNDPSVSGFKAIPMFGEISSLAVGPTTPVNNPVTLARLLAKVDVTLAPSITNFQLKSVRLYNANTQGRMVPESSNWVSAQNSVTAPSIPATSTSQATPIVYDGTEITSGNACINQIYTFEASKVTSSTFTTGVCLVIGGVYGSDPSETYYRVDFSQTTGNTTTYLDLLRNHHYQVNIASVSNSGLSTPTAALNAVPVNITAQVLAWNDAQLSDVVFDQQYSLAVSKGQFLFTSDRVDQNNLDNRLSVTTDYPGGWQLDKIVDSAGNPITWLTATVTAGQANTSTELQLLTPNNLEITPRTGYLYLKAGRMTAIVKIVQGELKWARGNLIADGAHGAVIGAPEDGGLYFQFGSLIGWSGGATGDGTGRTANLSLPALSQWVTPNGYIGSTAWDPSWSGDPATEDASAGTGDPCRFYLGRSWRLPTKDEYIALFANSGYPSNGPWTAVGTFAEGSADSYAVYSGGLKFPAAGARASNTGLLFLVGSYGNYWTISPYDAYNGYDFLLSSSNADPDYNDHRSYGFPVRCVQVVPPTRVSGENSNRQDW